MNPNINPVRSWLRTSLFSSREQWPLIFRNGIKPFMEKFTLCSNLSNIVIELNHLSGENIRFAFNTPSTEAKRMSDELDLFFKSIFQGLNSTKTNIELPVKGLFMPFPNNTIQYGLYHDLPPIGTPITEVISKTSECILEALTEENITDEVLIMSAYYFHCALLIQAKKVTEENYVHIYETEMMLDNGKISLDFLSDKYNENTIYLLEIKDSLNNFYQKDNQEIPIWLIDWMKVCRNTIAASLSENPNIIGNIHFCINRQLGLSNRMMSLVHYFITKTCSNL